MSVKPLSEAVTVAETDAATPMVVTENVALVAPAATVTEDGALAALLLHDRATVVPPAEAGRFSVTVPCVGFPPTRVVGIRDTPARRGVCTVSEAVAVFVPWVAVIVPVTVVVTTAVVIVNAAEFEPAATVTLDGTVALERLEAKFTSIPPVGAIPFN